jgi:hypothetical protein
MNEHKDRYNLEQIDWIGGFPDVQIPELYRNAEAVIFTAYPFDKNWIGEKTPISSLAIQSQLSDPLILRYAGDVVESELQSRRLRFYPEHVHAAIWVFYLAIGYDPIIRLQSGGLKRGITLGAGRLGIQGYATC